MKMKDETSRRVQLVSVTSYAQHEEMNHQVCKHRSVINMTIGSVAITLYYVNKEDRDFDISKLDEYFDKLEEKAYLS